MKPIRPVSQLGRPQVHGRIRTGDKSPKGAPRALSAFRFTSPDRGAIEALAGQYGGAVTEWVEPKAAVQGQWQVFTEASEIDVLLPEGALSTGYESWSGGGCQRRCDGETCVLPPNAEGDMEEAPCLCARQGVMVCSPKVRLAVALPGIEFRGVWRLDSSSWAAADEMSAIEPVLQQVQARGILRAKLVLERRSKMTGAGKRNFTVPKLVLAATLEELAAGMASLAGVPVHAERMPALGQGDDEGLAASVATAVAHDVDGSSGGYTPDDEITDAELIEQEDPPLTGADEGMTYLEKQWEWAVDVIEARCDLTRDEIIRGLCLSVSSGVAEKVNHLDVDNWGRLVGKAETLARSGFAITGVAEDGRLLVIRDGAA